MNSKEALQKSEKERMEKISPGNTPTTVTCRGTHVNRTPIGGETGQGRRNDVVTLLSAEYLPVKKHICGKHQNSDYPGTGKEE